MAIVWAKQAGNWTDTSLWAFWNETTQSIEDYGQEPQANDDVYANGNSVSIPNTNNYTISVKSLRNSVNPITNIGGGTFQTINSTYQHIKIYVNADIYNDVNSNNYVLRRTTLGSGGGEVNFYVNGNLHGNNPNQALINQGGQVSTGVTNFTINGNCYGRCFDLSNYTTFNILINGNVYVEDSVFINGLQEGGNTQNCPLQINGSFVSKGNIPPLKSTKVFVLNATTLDLECGLTNTPNMAKVNVRNYYYRSNIPQNFYSLSVIEGCYYTTNYLGVNCSVTYIGDDPDDFEWLYIGSLPNPNPYIIINPNTIADTYPTEDKVLAPTQYGAQMELVGTYTPDYPPESVVLKDVTYDNGNYTGTLETSNISQQLISRLENCATVETVQQLLVAHLDN